MSNEELVAQFSALDADGSGTIAASELLAQMPEGDQAKAQAVLAMMDTNEDGRVSYEEFVGFYLGGFEADESLQDADRDVPLDSLTDPDGDGFYERSNND